MKLATIRNDTRDGALVVVSRDLGHAQIAYDVAPTLQAALNDWNYCAPQLQNLFDELERQPGSKSFPFDPQRCMAPLPRAYQWLVAGAYLPHVEVLRKARGTPMPSDAKREPLMVQGNSDFLIGACDPIEAVSESWDIDLGAGLAVILGDIPMGLKHERAGEEIRLITLVNHASLRAVQAKESRRGLGHVQGRIATSFSPVAVTADELGAAWDGRRLLRPLSVQVNDRRLGDPDCGTDMQFDYPHLIAHAARTRPLGAGTLLGSGTISNRDHAAGFACIAEQRAFASREGRDPMPFLRYGDRVRIEMLDAAGKTIFGAIDQTVARHPASRRAVDVAAQDRSADAGAALEVSSAEQAGGAA